MAPEGEWTKSARNTEKLTATLRRSGSRGCRSLRAVSYACTGSMYKAAQWITCHASNMTAFNT